MNRLTPYLINLFLALTLTLIATQCQAACFQVDQLGRKWVTLNTTAKTIGIVANVKQCKTITIASGASPVAQEAACAPVPVQNQLCAATAKAMFDAEHQGMRLYVNPSNSQSDPCLFIKPTVALSGVTLQMYSAHRVDADGVTRCNP